MKVLVVLFVYSPERIERNNKKFRYLLETMQSARNFRIVVVNNSDVYHTGFALERLCSGLSNVDIISGSNEFAEFSAWVEGLNYAEAKGQIFDSFLLLNDTVFSHYEFYMGLYIKYLIGMFNACSANNPVAVGTLVDDLIPRVIFTGQSYDKFICTAFFCFNKASKPIFLESCSASFERWEQSKQFVNSRTDLLKCFFDETGVEDTGYWLFDGGWYNSKNFEMFDKQLLKLKLTAIVCEHHFSASLLEYKGTLVDVHSIRFSKLEFLSNAKKTLA